MYSISWGGERGGGNNNIQMVNSMPFFRVEEAVTHTASQKYLRVCLAVSFLFMLQFLLCHYTTGNEKVKN